MFTREELSNFMMPRKFGTNYVEIECGCTLRRFGDAYGHLRAYVDGRIEIDCQCLAGCPKVNLSPVQFGRHLGKNTTVDSWKQHLWVMDNDGNKIKLADTCLLRYHIQTFQRPLRPYVHRDEFIRCKRCNKERRFQLRTKEQCRIYHRASLNRDWKCSDTPELNMKCDDAEERKSRRPCRGCPKAPKCRGCVRCVCTGCHMCRFEDCDCQICIDFVQNEWHAGNN